MGRRHTCVDCAVKNSALCRALPAPQLAALYRHSYRRHHPPGRLIGGVDHAEDCFATVLSGVVKLTKSLADGRRQIVALLFPSDFLGRPFAAGGALVAEAATAVELCCFSREYFEELIRNQPQLKQLLLERTLDELDAARDWMFLLGRNNAQEKVAAFILHIWRRMRAADGDARCASVHQQQIDLPLSRSETAEYLGLRIETVSRQLQALRAAGIIETSHGRTMKVQDVRALERIVGPDPVR
jgi:CRP/FNR family transcriptional regulator, anaerobic regulatory protein